MHSPNDGIALNSNCLLMLWLPVDCCGNRYALQRGVSGVIGGEVWTFLSIVILVGLNRVFTTGVRTASNRHRHM